VFFLLATGFLAFVMAGCRSDSDHDHNTPNDNVNADVTASEVGGADCLGGSAGGYPCLNMDMLSGLDFSVGASDIWGWVDSVNGDEYAILGLTIGTVFIRITDPLNPEFVGFVRTPTTASDWHDVKVINDHALIVSEAAGHGLQVFDLTRLAALTEPTELSADIRYTQFGNAHNVAVNTDTGYAYVAGSNTCAGGLHMVDVSDPKAPAFAGCYSGDGYTHDVQCVVYAGPDAVYTGREICFASNEDTLTVVDVTDKGSPQLLARRTYNGAAYAHQGWLSEDHAHFFLGDEMDEWTDGHNTRTYIWNVSDLDNPQQTHAYTATTRASDHNMYVLEDHVYQANYLAGVRILRTGNLALGELAEVAYFDTVPAINALDFAGVWSVFPYFASGVIVTANTNGEFFVLRADLDAIPRCDDGLDNDADGATDFPADAECAGAGSGGLFEE
ncbi:MAG TPA: choice-of-anchor B family protein, partial [Gammaproteobacteria bacterium]